MQKRATSRAGEIAAMPTTPIGSKLRSRPGAWLVADFPGVLMRFVDERNERCFLQSLDGSPCYGWFDVADVWPSPDHMVVRHEDSGEGPLWYEVRGHDGCQLE
jgi:hypothetical protein